MVFAIAPPNTVMLLSGIYVVKSTSNGEMKSEAIQYMQYTVSNLPRAWD